MDGLFHKTRHEDQDGHSQDAYVSQEVDPRPAATLCQSQKGPRNFEHPHEREEQRADVAQVSKQWKRNAVKAKPAQCRVQGYPDCSTWDRRALRRHTATSVEEGGRFDVPLGIAFGWTCRSIRPSNSCFRRPGYVLIDQNVEFRRCKPMVGCGGLEPPTSV